MAKPKLVVDRDVLTEIVTTLEIGGALSNRNTLFKAAEKLYNAAKPEATISSAVIALRINEYGITLKTPIGKRGRPRNDSGAVAVIVNDVTSSNTEAPLEPVVIPAVTPAQEVSPVSNFVDAAVEVGSQEPALV